MRCHVIQKNIERERLLLGYWRQGYTIDQASLCTGTARSTTGRYYRRFNTNKDKYQKLVEGEFQEPPRPSPFTVAASIFLNDVVVRNVRTLVERGGYGEARDYLECLLLLEQYHRRVLSRANNANPKEIDKVAELLGQLYRALKAPLTATTGSIGSQPVPHHVSATSEPVSPPLFPAGQDLGDEAQHGDPKRRTHPRVDPLVGSTPEFGPIMDKIATEVKTKLRASKSGFVEIVYTHAKTEV